MRLATQVLHLLVHDPPERCLRSHMSTFGRLTQPGLACAHVCLWCTTLGVQKRGANPSHRICVVATLRRIQQALPLW